MLKLAQQGHFPGDVIIGTHSEFYSFDSSCDCLMSLSFCSISSFFLFLIFDFAVLTFCPVSWLPVSF